VKVLAGWPYPDKKTNRCGNFYAVITDGDSSQGYTVIRAALLRGSVFQEKIIEGTVFASQDLYLQHDIGWEPAPGLQFVAVQFK
jgi:hypothetical protein